MLYTMLLPVTGRCHGAAQGMVGIDRCLEQLTRSRLGSESTRIAPVPALCRPESASRPPVGSDCRDSAIRRLRLGTAAADMVSTAPGWQFSDATAGMHEFEIAYLDGAWHLRRGGGFQPICQNRRPVADFAAGWRPRAAKASMWC